jgi:hypothetical protein
MLLDFIQKAVELGASELEIDHKDGQERITALRGPFGFGIASVPSNTRESEALFDDIEALRRKKRQKLGGKTWRVTVSDHESFGEWAHRIQLTEVMESTPAPAPVARTGPRTRGRKRGPK